ncbi:MAG TPA: VanW family protein [Nannocystaceae bacterium]|nr:VanW family protein [Nannocystaceae bacterium]
MAVALVVALGVAADAHRTGHAREAPIDGVRLGGLAVGGLEGAALDAVVMAAVQASLDRPLVLRAGEVEVVTSARTLGAVGDPERARAAVLALGDSGDPVADLQARVVAATRGLDVAVGARFDEPTALRELLALAPALDRPSLPTRLDLERRKVEPAVLGTTLLAHDALSAVAIGLASGAATIELPVSHKPPVQGDALAELGDLDVSVVLGSFDTPYSMEAKEADRNFNLKVGATKVSGAVILPGETFSFNDRVGARDAENGFRYGGGITGGEIVDVLGGGICQVSSTLYGAAFFAGLEILEHRPHSRPSTYVDMGLDATVVWPDIDLKLKNPFDFPIVLHMSVTAGKARAEVLGARRPWQIAFERDLVEVVPHRTIYRDDASLKSGVEVTSQRGMRGFKVTRTRKVYQAGELLREEPETLSYPSTTQIIRRGTSPTGATPEPKAMSPLKDPAAHLRIMQ